MPLKVIGAGLPRTGTFSLKKALETLGFGPCHHHAEITKNPTLAFNWAKLADGEKVDWEDVFKGFSSTVDIPSVGYWRELAAHYPDAKVILSVRDVTRWYESMEQTILQAGGRDTPAAKRNREQPPEVRAARRKMIDRASIWDGLDRAALIALFERHTEEVKQGLPAGRLLVHEAKDGWEPLCRFLGVPVPAEPYPRTNATEEFGQVWEQL